MSRKPKAVVLDYDDTIVDFLGHVCTLHNLIHNTGIVTTDVQAWDWKDLEVKDARGNIVTGSDLKETFLKYEAEIYSSAKPIGQSRLALEIIKKQLGYKIIILTARNESFRKQTEYNLISEKIPYDELYFEWDKVKKIKELNSKYIISVFADDKGPTMQAVLDKCKVSKLFLLDKMHNSGYVFDEEDVLRVRDLLEIVRYLKRA